MVGKRIFALFFADFSWAWVVDLGFCDVRRFQYC